MKIKSLVFHLISESNGFLHKYNGPLIRAAFLKMIQKQNFSLASELHDSDERKPYFITSLKPEPFLKVKEGKNRKEYQVMPGQKYYSKINLFDENVFETLLKGVFATQETQKLRVGNNYFIIDKIEINSYDFQDLLNSNISSAKIIFQTPTFFKSKEGAAGIEYFPRPITTFKFIVNQWKHFPIEQNHMPPENFLEWVKNNVKVSSFKINSDSSHVMKKVPIMGTVGWVKYSWKKQENITQWIPLLLKYAEHTGLGALRTAGYGEIKVEFEHNQNNSK